MISLRAFARSAPRALSRMASSHAQKSALRHTAITNFKTYQTSAFSTSVLRRAPVGNEIDDELSAKLESEIQFECEVKENEPQPASVKDFLESGLFEIEDTPGQQEVVLKRTYNNENITVTFSIADLANYDPDMYDEDPALSDEEAEAAVSEQNARDEAALEEDGEEGTEEEGRNDAAAPCRLSIVVEKPGQGALSIDATAQDGGIVVENLYYFADAALAHGKSADIAHKADAVYPGPPFGSLDEDLQVLMERYLEERGVTQALAVFAPDYMDMKEQREYLGWLDNVKKFVDA